ALHCKVSDQGIGSNSLKTRRSPVSEGVGGGSVRGGETRVGLKGCDEVRLIPWGYGLNRGLFKFDVVPGRTVPKESVSPLVGVAEAGLGVGGGGGVLEGVEL